jgi:UDP-glucose 4-epimerase
MTTASNAATPSTTTSTAATPSNTASNAATPSTPGSTVTGTARPEGDATSRVGHRETIPHPPAPSRHVVIGAAGFLGGHLVDTLLDAGVEVTAVDVEGNREPHPRLRWIEGNAADAATVTAAVTGADVVHCLVAHVPLRRVGAAFHEANTIAPQVVAEVCAAVGVPQLVLVSTSAVYGIPDDPSVAGTVAPFEPYGNAKLAGERAAAAAVDGTGTRLAVLRPRTILGARRGGIFSTLFSFIAEGRKVYTIGDGNRPLQFVHVDDVVDAMCLLSNGHAGVFNVGATEYRRLRTELEAVITYAGGGSRVVALPERLALFALDVLYTLRLSPLSRWHSYGYAKLFSVDCSALEALGWRARWSTAAIMRDGWAQHRAGAAAGSGTHTSPMKERILSMVRRLS